MAESEPKPPLRGKLVPQPSLLRGSLLNKADNSASDKTEITMGVTLVQRDGGREYSVAGFTENKWGKKVNLISADGKDKVTLSQEDLEEKFILMHQKLLQKLLKLLKNI